VHVLPERRHTGTLELINAASPDRPHFARLNRNNATA
jgi:hypothetical protein